MKRLAFLLVLAVAGIGATSAAFAAPAYELTIVPAASAAISPTCLRINVATGQVLSYVSGTQFAPVPDPAPLPAGDYHLHMVVTLDGKGLWYVMRMDSQSGRDWQLSGGGGAPFVWTEITAPK